MTGNELMGLVRAGFRPVVTCLEKMEEQDAFMRQGMRGRVVGVSDAEGEDVLVFKLDISEFEDFNRSFETSDYFDENDVPRLTAREAGCYSNSQDVWTSSDGEISEFEVTDEGQLGLMEQYRQAGLPGSYVSWLERTVIGLRSEAVKISGKE